jgi:16S rRNA (guanine527-N7)-methyltransferase
MPQFTTTIVVYSGNEINVPSSDSVSVALGGYGIELNDLQVSQIQRYIACLVFWNQRVSLTSVCAPMEILERHFAESMLPARLINNAKGRLADVGSGPGFPGLALKIAIPSLQVLLIERNTKKSAFLSEAIRFLDLASVSVIRSDFAAIPASEPKFDYITARALGDHKDLLRWTASRLTPTGMVVLWLGSQDSLKLAHSKSWHWEPPIPVPNSQRRVILAGRPIL